MAVLVDLDKDVLVEIIRLSDVMPTELNEQRVCV
jgi:hypothetical protein